MLDPGETQEIEFELRTGPGQTGPVELDVTPERSRARRPRCSGAPADVARPNIRTDVSSNGSSRGFAPAAAVG